MAAIKIIDKTNNTRKVQPWHCALMLLIPVIVMIIIMITGAFRYESGNALPFIGQYGVFKYNNIRVAGIRLYDIMLFVGIIASFVMPLLRSEKYGLSRGKALAMSGVYVLFVTLFGPSTLFSIETFISTGKWNHIFLFNGLSMFGAVYVSFVAIPLIGWIFREDIRKMYDFFLASGIVILTFTRVGCFFSGCCGAKALPIGGQYVKLPVQLFEIAGDLLILSLYLWMEDHEVKIGARKINCFSAAMVLYCILRFTLEFLRTNEVLSTGITIAQTHCIICVAVGLIILFTAPTDSRKKSRR